MILASFQHHVGYQVFRAGFSGKLFYQVFGHVFRTVSFFNYSHFGWVRRFPLLLTLCARRHEKRIHQAELVGKMENLKIQHFLEVVLATTFDKKKMEKYEIVLMSN